MNNPTVARIRHLVAAHTANGITQYGWTPAESERNARALTADILLVSPDTVARAVGAA